MSATFPGVSANALAGGSACQKNRRLTRESPVPDWNQEQTVLCPSGTYRRRGRAARASCSLTIGTQQADINQRDQSRTKQQLESTQAGDLTQKIGPGVRHT